MSKFTQEARRIAVLPFTNISADPADEYFADGMTEELILALSKINQLRVIARTSVMKYKGQTKSIAEIGKELGVGTLIEGSVRKDGDKIRIGLQLIDANTEERLWSTQYDRLMKDIFAIQSDIAKKVASALKVKILQKEAREIEKESTQDFDAYSEYLNGRFHWNQRTDESLKKAIAHFTSAIARDPAFGLAYAGLADSYAMLALIEALPPSQAFPKAKAAAEKALQVDSTLAEAHSSLGLIKFQYERDWAGSEVEFKRAVELNPNYPSAHHFYADYLKAMGRFPEAMAQMKIALELDPLSLSINTGLGHVMYLSREYDLAIDQYQKAVDLDPNFLQAHLWFGRPYLQKGMYAEALSEVSEAVKLSGESTMALAVLGHVYASAGKKPEAEHLLQKLKERAEKQYVPSYWIALIYVGLEDKDQAFIWLDRAFAERSSWLAWVNVEPRFDGLRSDPRFSSLIKKMGLDDSKTSEEKIMRERLVGFLSNMSNLRLAEFVVTGNYTRYEESVRNLLKDFKQKIIAGLSSNNPKHENYLIWAPPGSGKTFFIQQISEAAKSQVDYKELNLAELNEEKFKAALAETTRTTKSTICLIDEVDSKANQKWPYEALLIHIDSGAGEGGRRTFVLAGSSGSNLDEFKENISARSKGADLLSRIPYDNEYALPALMPEDRILVALSTLLSAGKKMEREVSEIEKLALYYIAVAPGLSSARQLREFTYRCLERIPQSEDRVKYDYLFNPGNKENKEFWVRARSEAPELINSFVLVK